MHRYSKPTQRSLPTWLAPVQVQVIAVSDRFDEVGRTLVDKLRSEFVRVELAHEGVTNPLDIIGG